MIKKRNNLIGSLLICFWILCSVTYIYQKELSFSLVVIPQRLQVSLTKEDLPRSKTHLLKGSFRSTKDNLGIVFVKSLINTNLRRENNFTFRLKERGRSDWYYQSTRRLSPSLTYFPYGFPIVKDSKDKNYEFEIQTDSEDYISGVQSDIFKPALLLGFQFAKKDILDSGASLGSFLLVKILSWLQDSEFLLISFILALPALYYYFGALGIRLYKRLVKRILQSRRKYFFSSDVKDFFRMLDTDKRSDPIKFFIFILGITIFMVEDLSNLVIILILSIWTLITMRYKLSSKNSFMMGLGLIITTALFVLLGWTSVAVKSSALIFAFLLFGVVQAVYEMQRT